MTIPRSIKPVSLTFSIAAVALSLLSSPSLAHTLTDLLPGTYTNTEQVYFQGEAGEEQDRPLALRFSVDDSGAMMLHSIDPFGEPLYDGQAVTLEDRDGTIALIAGDCTRVMQPDGEDFVRIGDEGDCANLPAQMERISASGMTFRWPDGRPLDMRRARPVSCWVSVKRDEPDDNGEDSWTFDNNLMMHDQGGHIRAGGGNSGAPEAIVRMRNVVWPEPTRNRPSLVMYIHRPDDLVRAVSYSWADPGAERIGINLRWMQASCTIQSDNNGDTE